MESVQKNIGNTGIIVNQGYGDYCIEVATDDIPATVEKMLKAYLELKEER